MTKLLVCSDTLLIKRKEICNFVCTGLDHFIENGNRFLMTSRKPLQHLYDVKLPEKTYLPAVKLIKNDCFRYTDVSCLNGLFLYDAKDNLLNYDSLEPNVVQKLLELAKELNDVEASIVTPEGYKASSTSLNNTIVGSVKFNVFKGSNSEKAKYELRKITSKLGLILCRLDMCDGVFEYDIRTPKSNESIQRGFLRSKHGVADGDVLLVDAEIHTDIQRKIKEFMGYQ